MSKIKAVLASFIVAGFLAGCNTTVPSVNVPTVAVTVTDLQNAVVSACGFLPAATTIASILSANPAITTGGQIAGVICDAVIHSRSAKRGANQDVQKFIVINNKVVEINGRFVK